MYTVSGRSASLLAARADREPDREIVRFEETAVTFGGLDDTASRLANSLPALGLEQGDRAAIMLGNRAEYLGLWFGMARAGIVEVPLNTGVRGDMLVHMLNTTGSRLLVIDAQWLERIERIATELEALERIVVVGDGALDGIECLPHAALLDVPASRPPAVATAPRRLRDPLHVGHDRAVEGRRAHPQRERPGCDRPPASSCATTRTRCSSTCFPSSTSTRATRACCRRC